MAGLRPRDARRAVAARPDRCGDRAVHDGWNESRGRPGIPAGAAPTRFSRASHRGIAPIVTLFGAPRWSNWVALRARRRRRARPSRLRLCGRQPLPWVQSWLVWNEPNQRRWLSRPPRSVCDEAPQSGVPAIHGVPGSGGGGGVTAPRGSNGASRRWPGSVGWAPQARLDAYAHNPYPLNPLRVAHDGRLQPLRDDHDGDARAAAPRGVASVRPLTRIWLTEYGYQTSPPDRALGVSKTLQARYLSEAAYRAFAAPKRRHADPVSLQGRAEIGRWQSGYIARRRQRQAFIPCRAASLAQVSRIGVRTVLWGQVRSGNGRGATSSSSSETVAGVPLAGSRGRTRTDS